jgi:UDP-glucose 4-epimerase
LSVLIAAEAVGARKVVYASSSSVYGGVLEGKSREDMPIRPLSPYAVSKAAGEMYCTVWSSLGRMPTTSLRYFNVFGPGQPADSQYAAVFPAFISALKRGEPPEIHWDGEQLRDFTYIDDVVRANLLAGDSARIGVMNIARGSPRTINSVYADIARVLGTTIEPIRRPKRPGDIRNSHADVSLARRVLSWKAESDWEDAVRATVGWFA